MKKNILFLIISLIFTTLGYAQQIGEWTVHSSGRNVIGVDIMNDKIIASTPYDLFFVNTHDNSINRLTKANGLSDFGVKTIKYDKTTDVVFIGYTNTNIDLIDCYGNIYNIPDIKNKNILGSKVINDVLFYNNNIYVCCGFGIVVIDMKKLEVKDTYIIGENASYLNVNDLTVYNDNFYAATSEGIYFADVNSTNLVNFNQWTLDETITYPFVEYKNVEVFSNSLIANAVTNGLYDETFIFNGIRWESFLPDERNVHTQIRNCGDRLVMVNDTIIITTSQTYQVPCSVKVFDSNANVIDNFKSSNMTAAVYDNERKCYWFGTNNESLLKYENKKYERFPVDGPYSNFVFELKAEGKDIWVASGGYSSTWANRWRHDGAFHFNGEKWSYLNNSNNLLPSDFYDITCTACVPGNGNKVYIGSYMRGIMLFDDNKQIAAYDETNSTLGFRTAALPSEYVCVTGMDFDSKGTLWVANSGADNLISSLTSSGTWQSHNVGSPCNDVSHLMVDKNDIVWLQMREGQATVYNGKTYKTINTTQGHGGLPGTAGLKCFATDRNGTVWIGTDDGVAMFYNSKKIFDNSSYNCSRILVPRNDGTGQADYLLSGLTVNCIASDGANKMWFGTNNGAFYISNDGLTEYLHFTTDNSPLMSNNIENIAIDSDGVVFFSTTDGLISYKNTATPGGKSNSNVIVFPNPVNPDYSGVVGIKGLVEDALVKITTSSGAFVTHLKAEGGQAVWNRTDIKGRRVEPGIYVIFVSDETGKETYCTKVLIK